MKLLMIYFICINFVGLFLMFSDKRRARYGDWRIPERILFFAAVCGGSLGSILGMWLFRHKTRHWYFVLGMPFILLVQLVLAALLLSGKG